MLKHYSSLLLRGRAGEAEGGGSGNDQAVKELQQQLAALKIKLEKTERAHVESENKRRAAKLSSTLRNELSKYVPVERLDGAVRIFEPEVKYDENGQMVGGLLDQPITKFVQSEIEKYGFLTNNRNGEKARPAKGIDLDAIKPGATRETLDRARQEIAEIVGKR